MIKLQIRKRLHENQTLYYLNDEWIATSEDNIKKILWIHIDTNKIQIHDKMPYIDEQTNLHCVLFYLTKGTN